MVYSVHQNNNYRKGPVAAAACPTDAVVSGRIGYAQVPAAAPLKNATKNPRHPPRHDHHQEHPSNKSVQFNFKKGTPNHVPQQAFHRTTAAAASSSSRSSSSSRMNSKGGGFQHSVVFLKKKTAQAVLLQTHIRGYLARRSFRLQLHKLRLEQEQRQRERKQYDLISLVQASIRGYLHRRQYQHLMHQSRAVIPLQALVRGVLQRNRWLSSSVTTGRPPQKLELRLLQIQRQEQAELEAIDDEKRQRMKALDQTLEDFHREQRQWTDKSGVLDEKTHDQCDLKDQLRRENKQFRNKIDRLVAKQREIRAQSQRMEKTIHLANHSFLPQLQQKVAQLEMRIQKLETALGKYETTEQRMTAKLGRLEERLISEHCQERVYQKFAGQLLQKVQERCPQDRLLQARCTALVQDDSVSLRVIALEERLQEAKRQTRDDVKAIRRWKKEQLKQQVPAQVEEEFQQAAAGQRLQQRHVQEYAVWLKRKYDKRQSKTQERQHLLETLQQELNQNQFTSGTKESSSAVRLQESAASPVVVQKARNKKLRTQQPQEQDHHQVVVEQEELEAVQRACEKKQRKLDKVAAKIAKKQEQRKQVASCIWNILDVVEKQYDGDNRDKLLKKLRRAIQKSPLVQEQQELP